MPKIATRAFTPQDAPDLANLLREMTTFYGAFPPPDLAIPDDVVHQARHVEITLAHRDSSLVGFATSTTLYPVAGLLAFTYVQQIYVAQTARRLGVAQTLLAEIARTAKARGNTRIEWSTAADNTAAQALYEGLGANGSPKIHYVLEGDALNQLAAPPGSPAAPSSSANRTRPGRDG